jgi:UPF0716 family protein affecting phage T7 exclusion
MSLLQKWRRAGAKVDRVAGRLVYRCFGAIAAIIGALTLWASYDLIASGNSIVGAILLGIPGLLCLWLAKWCFSPARKLSEIEF